MAWNEPGDQNQDPWGRKPKKDGPPDLDELLSKLSAKLSGLFGGKPVRSSNGGGSGEGGGTAGLIVVGVAAVFIWGLSGFYTIQEAERGVVLRFGAYSDTVGSGIHWRPTFIERVIPVDVSKVISRKVTGKMLTEDENIAEVELGVQYRITDPVAYLFNVRDPEGTMKHVAESALRLVVGQSSMDELLTGGRDLVRTRSEAEMVKIIEPYKTGLVVTEVTLQVVKAPDEVQAAFDDAIKAREDEERFITEAKAYAGKQQPIAEGRASRILQEAEAYKQEVVAKATGEVARFLKVLPEYQASPAVTRERLYLETMQQILSGTSKVLIDNEGGNNMLYLPLDKLMNAPRSNFVPRSLDLPPPVSETQSVSPVSSSSDPYLNTTGK